MSTLLLCSSCSEKQGIRIGDNAPVIAGTDIHDKVVNHSRLTGKIVVIYFWTNSCCGDSLKQLEPVYGKFAKNGLEILAINERDERKAVEAYAAENSITFTMLADEQAKLFEKYHGLGFPTIFIVDRNGIIREKILGNIEIAKLEKLIQRQFDIIRNIDANYEKTHSR